MAVPYIQVSRDAQVALTQFSDELRQALALGDFEAWAAGNGLVRPSDALRTVWPIPLSAAGYHEFKGDPRFRRLYERSLSMTAKEFQDGVREKARVIEAPDFIDWAGEPGRMAQEWLRLPNVLVMQNVLEASPSGGTAHAGPFLDFYRDNDSSTASTKQLFDSAHPCNVLDTSIGTFDNTMNTTVAEIQSGAFFDAVSLRFRQVNGPNGRPLGLRMGGGKFLIHPQREGLFKRALETDTVIRAVSNAGALDATSNVVAAVPENNIYQKSIGYTVTDESSQSSVFYAIASGRPGLYPWVAQQGTLEQNIFDKNSEMYKLSRDVAVSLFGVANVAGCLPHGIIKVTITG